MAEGNRRGITNTTNDPPIVKLMTALPGGIEAQEAAGQRELVHSDRLPTEVLYATDADFEALGFTFGEPDPADTMFRPATLPEGWRREGSSHSMWSYIVDERGLERVGVFYKAAFYDRRAHMSITNVGYNVASAAIYDDTKAIPWDLLTEPERAAAVEALEDMRGNAAKYPDTYGKYDARVGELLPRPTTKSLS